MFLEALKDIIGVILLSEAAIGHKDESMTDDYLETLMSILNLPNGNKK